MNSKQFSIKAITYTLISLLIIGALIIVVDPFLHYHAPLGKLSAAETDERSQMIGVAANMNYETALIGSSMSENFVASWFNDGHFGSSSVKLCMQGAHFSDYDFLFKEVTNHPEVKNIVFSLDNYLLTNYPDQYPVTIPSYLSNEKVLDDAYYIWNQSVLFEYLPKFLINNFRTGFNSDSAYVWAPDYEFSRYAARNIYSSQRKLTIDEEKPFDTYFENADKFLSSITPYIESRPDITFYFYTSPYSIYFWDDCVRHGNLTAEICTLERVYKVLLGYENVKIFYFQNDYNIITNLDNYRDYSHFDQPINRYMYECMRDGKKEVSIDTYFDTLLEMYDFAESYDYESAFH